MYDAIFLDDVNAVRKIIDSAFNVNEESDDFGFKWLEFGYGIEKMQYERLGDEKKYGDCVKGTPLTCASFLGRENIVMLLLSSAAESTWKNSLGETARTIAGHSENHNIVKLFKHFDGDNQVKKERQLNEKRVKKEKKKETSKSKKEIAEKEKLEKKRRIEQKRGKSKQKQEHVESEDSEEEEGDTVENIKNLKI